MIEHVSQNVIDQRLKNGTGIREAEGHYKILKMAQGSIKCHLALVSLLNAD